MKPDVAHGKAFEKEVHDQFRELYTSLPILWERVIDTHDAGNIVKKADSDFKLTIRSKTHGRPYLYFIECKASTVYSKLTDNGARRSLIKPDQIAKLRMAQRAGVEGRFLFKSVNDQRIEWWDAERVIEAWGKKRFNWVAQPLDTFSCDDLPKWAALFVRSHL
jgi:hypothetical protein